MILNLFVKFLSYFIVGTYILSEKRNRPQAIILMPIESLKQGIETPMVLLGTTATLCDGMNFNVPQDDL